MTLHHTFQVYNKILKKNSQNIFLQNCFYEPLWYAGDYSYLRPQKKSALSLLKYICFSSIPDRFQS